MGILDGGGSSVLNSVFAAIYPSGFLVKAKQGGYEDAGGSWVDPPDPPDPIPIKVQTDTVTEVMRQAAGYTDRDVRLIVLSAGVTEITSDDQIIDGRGDTWNLIDPALDTCGSHWVMRGQRVS